MSTPMVAMDPEKKDDAFYRYKMPAFVTKVEGNGNGIKTVFPNIHDVCSSINRPESIMMKFFQFELGTQRTVSTKDDKFIVMGSRTQEEMQEKVYAFISKFVLCKHCRNPETQVLVDAKDRVTLRCGACGKVSLVSVAERCTSLLAQHYKNVKAPSKTATTAPSQKTTADAVDEAGAAAAPAAQAATSELAPVHTDDRANPAIALAKALASEPSATESHIKLVYELRTLNNLSEKVTVRLVFLSIVEVNPAKYLASMKQHRKLLSRFVLVKELTDNQSLDEATLAEAKKREKSLQDALVGECERYLVSSKRLWQLPILLLLLFEEGVLKQQAIEKWAPSSKLSEADQAELKKCMEPFLTWLHATD